MNRRCTAILVVILWTFAADAFCQLYSFRNYTPSRGLPQSTVNAIFQDDRGYLWFATAAGVSRFDGFEFEVFNTANGLADDCVYCIMQDSDGVLWLGTNRGICKYDGKNWQINDLQQYGEDFKVFSALEDSGGRLWFGTDIGVLSLQNGQWKHFAVGDGLVDNYVNGLFEDSDGNMWIATRNGLSRFADDKWTSYRVEDGLPANGVNSIVQDRKGFLWVGTVNGLARLEGESWRQVDAHGRVAQRDVKTVYEDSKGNLWFGMRGGGVVKFDGERWTTFTASNGLVHNRVTAIFEDRERNMWFGTERGGVSQLTGEAFSHYRLGGGRRDRGLSGNLITSLLEDSSQRLWVGTCMGGVSVFDGGRWRAYTTDDGLTGNCVTSIAQHSDGDIWAGTENGGVCKFDGKGWKVVVDGKNGSEENRINNIEEDNRGNLWFATNHGALKYDGARWTGYSVEDGLAGSVVNDILQTTGGWIWFATGEGVSRFDGAKWDTYTKQDGLVGNQVFHMFEDNDRNIWFATSEGLSRYDGTGFSSLTVEDGLSSKFCYFVVGYRDNLFIGTSKGISRFDGQAFRVYTVQDGLPSNEMTAGACLKDHQDKLWFGSTSGLTRFDPLLERENSAAPPVYITAVTLEDTSLAVDRAAELSHERNDVKFDFVSLCFTAPEDLTYNYKLEGWDSDWQQTDQRSARYTHLPSGEYTFMVKARNKAGIWSESAAQFRFSFARAFWETTLFKVSALLLLFGLGLITVMRWYRTRISREVDSKNSEIENMMAQLRIQQQEKEKTNELRTKEQQAFESLADSLEEGIAVVQTGRIVFVNNRLASLLGSYKEKLLGREFSSMISEESRPGFSRLIESSKPYNGHTSIKAVIQDSSNKEVWTEIRVSAIDWLGEKADLLKVRDISGRMIKEFTVGGGSGEDTEQGIPNSESTMFGEIVGKSAPMKAVYKLIEKASDSNANIIIYGETGTGKELAARTVHNMSQRAGKPFVVVNCGAIPSSLFESEFFGYRKGAFTGAYEDKQGFFDIADGGTLFLDEVGELDASMQVKLLRAVEGESYAPVGGGDQRKSDVRIIGATNRDLSTGVKNGEMRSDFFYRMHIVPITLPPLRERREDIPLLLKHFVSRHSGKSVSDIPEEILEKLYNYDWPGNVRQLQNVILRYLTVGQFDLMEDMVEKKKLRDSVYRRYKPGSLNLKEETGHFEKQVILEALNLTQWHKSNAAAMLGVTRRTLFRKMKDYGISDSPSSK